MLTLPTAKDIWELGLKGKEKIWDRICIITERVQADPGYSSPELLLSALPLSYAELELGRAELEAQLLDRECHCVSLKSVCKREDQHSVRT